jgi:hypothetical protein
MGTFKDKITITTCEGRPCWVDGRRAIFHRWTDSARPAKLRRPDDEESEELRLQIHNVHGLVEYEDGRVEREWPNKIHFADSAGKFAQFDWETMEQRQNALPWEGPEPAEETTAQGEPQEDQQPPEIWKQCETCAHGSENEEFCKVAEYNCKACTVRGCYCKRCRDFDRWEAKEGAVC